MPRGLEDVSKYPSLLAELLDSDRGWREEDVKKLAGGNLLRVFREVERVCTLPFWHDSLRPSLVYYDRPHIPLGVGVGRCGQQQ